MRHTLLVVVAAASAFQVGAPRRRAPTRVRAKKDAREPGFDPRFGWFGLELGFVLADAVGQAARGKTGPGDLIIAGRDAPALNVVKYQSYVLRRVYWQRVDGDGRVERVDADSFDDPAPPGGGDRYVELYSPRYHAKSGPVVARVDECEPTSLRQEIVDSVPLALPGFFWVFVAAKLVEYGRATGRL